MIGAVSISLLIHAGLLTVFAFLTGAVGPVDTRPRTFTAHLVASSPDQTGDGFRFPGPARIDRPDSAKSMGPSDASPLRKALSNQKSPGESLAAAPGAGFESQLQQSLSRRELVGAEGGRGEGGLGAGLGDRDVAGGGPVGSLWGVGEGQQAASIVYVLDRSGSMSDTFDQLQRELMNAIGSLENDQRFNVIWFNEGPPDEMFPRLVPATIENKQQVFKAIRAIVPSGRTEPLKAVQKGLAAGPDVLYLLSDGDFGEANDKIIRSIQWRNKKRRTVINTILFVYDTVGDGERVLRTIAESSGGVYKHVTESDIAQ